MQVVSGDLRERRQRLYETPHALALDDRARGSPRGEQRCTGHISELLRLVLGPLLRVVLLVLLASSLLVS